jgi:hypothetical protein
LTAISGFAINKEQPEQKMNSNSTGIFIGVSPLPPVFFP